MKPNNNPAEVFPSLDVCSFKEPSVYVNNFDLPNNGKDRGNRAHYGKAVPICEVETCAELLCEKQHNLYSLLEILNQDIIDLLYVTGHFEVPLNSLGSGYRFSDSYDDSYSPCAGYKILTTLVNVPVQLLAPEKRLLREAIAGDALYGCIIPNLLARKMHRAEHPIVSISS